MTTERFYVKGSHIKCKGKKGWLTIDEICQILNNYDQLLEQTGDEILRLKELLLKCKQLLNKLWNTSAGKRHFAIRYMTSEIEEVLDQQL